MRRIVGMLIVILLVSGVTVAQPAETPGPGDEAPDTPENQTVDNDEGNGGPPGFVSGIVSAVTPDFLGDLFANLPVPGFLKNFFG